MYRNREKQIMGKRVASDFKWPTTFSGESINYTINIVGTIDRNISP